MIVLAYTTYRSPASLLVWIGAVGAGALFLQGTIVLEDCMIFNRYYLDAERFPVIASMPLRELHGANFAGLIHATYNLPITQVARTIQCTHLPKAACRAIGIPLDSYGLVMEIAASAGLTRPVFYQQLFVPANAGKLFITDSFNRWIGSPESSPPQQVRKADSKRKLNRRAVTGK